MRTKELFNEMIMYSMLYYLWLISCILCCQCVVRVLTSTKSTLLSSSKNPPSELKIHSLDDCVASLFDHMFGHHRFE